MDDGIRLGADHHGRRASIPGLEWYRAVQARTAIGLSQDGRTLTLFTVDQAGGREGMQVGEVADVLRRDYGVWDALNLDAAARRRWRWRIR